MPAAAGSDWVSRGRTGPNKLAVYKELAFDMHRRNVLTSAAVAISVRTEHLFAQTPAPRLASQQDSSRTANVRTFGAVGDGVADDTDAIQRALDAERTVFFPPGTYRVQCLPDPPFTYGNSPESKVFRAVSLRHSGTTLIGDRATIKVHGFGRGRLALNYAFGTAKHLDAGALRDFTARGLRFDFDPTIDNASNKRSFYLGGVRGIRLEDIELMSSGERAGGTITLQQCSDVTIKRLRLRNCTQGMNFSYVTRVVGEDWHFENFKEAVDFDRCVSAVVLKNLTFLNAQENSQCLDLNSVQDVLLDGIRVDSVGQVALINYKHTTPPTYAEYVSNSPVVRPTVSRNVVIRGVRGATTANRKIPTFAFGLDRTSHYAGFGPCENLTLEDVHLKDCSYISVKDVRGFKLRGVTLENVGSPASPGYGAITVFANGNFTESEVEGDLESVRIQGCTGIGLRISAPSRLRLSDVSVVGFNREQTAGHATGIDIQALNNRPATLIIEKTRVAGAGNGFTGWRFSENGSGAHTPSILWGSGNSIASVEFPLVFTKPDTENTVQSMLQVALPPPQPRVPLEVRLAAPSGQLNVRICSLALHLLGSDSSTGRLRGTYQVFVQGGGPERILGQGTFDCGDCHQSSLKLAATDRLVRSGEFAAVRLNFVDLPGDASGAVMKMRQILYSAV
jgi:hypothetical protein